jgi:uncharacterized membrane protein YbaN (DUF454 family)
VARRANVVKVSDESVIGNANSGAGQVAAADATVVRSRPVRWMWFGVGWVAVGLGTLGVIVPGLPTTVFFIVAASCFARSSPRFERWVLGLPRVGVLVSNYRDGLGMPRRAKAWAIGMIVVFAGSSAVFSRERLALAGAIAALGAIGIAYILVRVPTRERVLAERQAVAASPGAAR